jgi:hypothetical protein
LLHVDLIRLVSSVREMVVANIPDVIDFLLQMPNIGGRSLPAREGQICPTRTGAVTEVTAPIW